MIKSTKKLIDFFISKRWTTSIDNNDIVSLIPPIDLNFSNDFQLIINKEINNKYFENKMSEYLQIISDIYSIDIFDLQTLFLDEKDILSIRIADDDTKHGDINLSRFDYFIQKISDILLKTADFVLENKIQCSDASNNPRANSFLNSCKFLQTQRGSFVTRIALPVEETIKPSNLFDGEIKASEVNRKFFSILDFANKNFFEDEEIEYNEIFIKNNREFINIDILKDINSLYKYGIKDIEFSYLDSESYIKKETKPKKIIKKRIESLSEFVNKIEKDTIQNYLNSTCYVIGLRDKLLEDGKKHCMTLLSTQFGNKIEIQLDDVSDQIQNLATDAYKNNLSIKVEGEIEELKSYLRITKLKKFNNIDISY